MGHLLYAQEPPLLIAAFDACHGETHGDAVMATQHNVEAGAPITDHVRPEPAMLSLQLEVTNTPLDRDPDQLRGGPQVLDLFVSKWKPPFDGTPGALFREAGLALRGGIEPEQIAVEVFSFPVAFDRIAETEQKLIDLKGKLCTYVSLSRDYTDMVMTRFELQRTSPGSALFTIDLQQIRFVTSATVAAPQPAEPRGAPMSKKGQQAPKTPADAAQLGKSDVLKILDQVKTLAGGAPV